MLILHNVLEFIVYLKDSLYKQQLQSNGLSIHLCGSQIVQYALEAELLTSFLMAIWWSVHINVH